MEETNLKNKNKLLFTTFKLVIANIAINSNSIQNLKSIEISSNIQ